MLTGSATTKIIVLVAAVAVVALAFTGNAYAYSSNSASDSNATFCDYLTINVYEDGEGDSSVACNAVFSIDGASADKTENSTTFVPTSDYTVKISSSNLSEAFVYGYFVAPETGNAEVQSIVFTFDDGTTGTLYSGAYRTGLSGSDSAVALGEESGVFTKDLKIVSVTVNYYGFVDAGSISDEDILSGFVYCFSASADSLITA